MALHRVSNPASFVENGLANQALQRARFARLLNGRTVSCVDEASHDLAQQKQILNCVVMAAICV